MNRVLSMIVVVCFFAAGCDSLRFAPSETEKQNAWLHLRTTQLAADASRAESASEQLQQLTSLSAVQGRAFVAYCGMPKEPVSADSIEQVLAERNMQLAQIALQRSSERPDAWQLADSALELAIGIAAVLGGVYGTKAARFLKEARAKSKALHEVIAGNEFFKKQNQDTASAFKAAQKGQSPVTRQIVAQMKG